MQGSVKDIGVQARDPSTEINLSRELPREIQKPTVRATMMVRDRFFNHILFLDLGIPLKM
jgi:hypothetical protein